LFKPSHFQVAITLWGSRPICQAIIVRRYFGSIVPRGTYCATLEIYGKTIHNL